ncbi:MAG: glycoside hydrolase family 97 protein, partial [Bacteroidales bacterium]|nr:glycoside hydrolase family 97 protein [Bacteroidales bacterium]
TSGNRLAMEVVCADGKIKTLGDKAGITKNSFGKKSGKVITPFYRKNITEEKYNFRILQSWEGYDIEMRAYNQGVAYRFVTRLGNELTVNNEIVEFRTDGKMDAIIPYQYGHPRKDKYECSFENQYDYYVAGETPRNDMLAFLPMLADTRVKGKLLLMESDIEDYPGMYVNPGKEVWTAEFPPIPGSFEYSKRFNQHRSEYGDIIAKTSGNRSFPWRIIGYAQEDKDLPVNDLSWLLAAPSRIKDYSWVEAGLSAWDWWNGFYLSGVDFESGINTATYKYHIDFAASYGLKYIILDEGWYKAPDIMTTIPEIDLPEICRYAQSKGVKVVIWSTGGLVDKCGIDTVFSHYAQMGVAGFKLDFFDGQDQLTVNQIWRLAESAAREHLILDLHGMYKPAGLNRTWPNILGFEGVYGLENLSRKNLNLPLYDVTFPYLRQVSGPTDYTPGAMRNAAKGQPTKRGGASQGTRAHQVGLFVVLDQPFGILCDSPSRYEADPATTRFITSIPTVFDETFIQSGKIGESIVTVRRKDNVWYVGGLTNWNSREVTVDFSFLKGKWKATIYKDGPNASSRADDYVITTLDVDASTRLTIPLAMGGGFAIILKK